MISENVFKNIMNRNQEYNMLLEMEHITITAGQKNILKNFFLNIKEN